MNLNEINDRQTFIVGPKQNIFKDRTNQCVPSDYTKCDAMKCLCTATKHYTMIQYTSDKNVESSNETLTRFMNNTYDCKRLIDDLMLTGGWLKFMKVTEDDIFVIESLVNDILHPKKGDKPFDEYIYSTFAAFIQSKKRITFHLQELKNANKEIRDLLLNELNESNVRTDDYRSNLFKKQIFAIFKNVRSIVIQTGKDQSVSMSELLSLIELGSLDIVTVQVGCKSATWISELWKASSHTLERQYDDGNYVLSYHEDKHNYKFVIHKKHHCV
eukprot:514719_1